MTSVIVERYPFGSSLFSRCTADLFEHDELTITSVEPGFERVIQVFPPGTWRTATVINGSHGYPAFPSFIGSGNTRPFPETRTA